MSISLVKILDVPWELARTNLRQNLESIQTAFNQFLINDKLDDATISDDIILSDSALIPIDASTGTVFRIAATGNRTLGIPTKPSHGQRITIEHFAAGGANRTLTLSTGTGGFRFTTTFPALSATVSGKTDYIQAIFNDNDNFWDIINYVKG